MDDLKKILVVDDLEANRDIFTSLLEDKYQVMEAGNGQEGLELAEKEHPDLIFLDLSMPGMGGLEMVRLLRRHGSLYPIPVIAVTALTVVNAKQALEAGCNDYLLKPLLPGKIHEKVDQWIY